ncbi:MAG: RtcB family protein [Deltaproteobacteria bacterium]|nr:RtcB family protein [Deltaproteobacteria bacterium]
MNNTITTEKLPIKLWTNEIEEGALHQTKNLANHPCAFKHVAIMPDVHEGYGMPIGGVIAVKEALIPNAVGVDIGCGVCAVKTDIDNLEKKQIETIVYKIKSAIPTGFKWHSTPLSEDKMPQILSEELTLIVCKEYKKARKQLGTLGGGNHFIEIQKGKDNYIWIMIHSGSRNLGKQIADTYNRYAKKFNEKLSNPIPKSWQLAYLPIDNKKAQQYKAEMQYCISFALANRQAMMEKSLEILIDVTGSINYQPLINIAHNYAAYEKHFKKDLFIHRKGATSAKKGEIGIIPGSQGTNSFIVKGKGNPESFKSCSHGAGRRLGRKQAVKELDFKKEVGLLDKKGILHFIRSRVDLDEAPGAYKNIDTVIKNQADLVDIIEELEPLAVIKG